MSRCWLRSAGSNCDTRLDNNNRLYKIVLINVSLPYIIKYIMELMQRITEPVLGFEVDLFTFNEAMIFVHQHLKENRGLHVVTINPEMISLGTKNQEFGRILNEADLSIPDGVGIKLALKIKGIKQENIPGIEFSKKLIGLCSLEGYTIGLVGAKEEVVQQAAANLRKEFDNLNITYIHNGYFDETQEELIKEEIKNISPRVVFVALGAPKQEIFISKLKEQMPHTIFIGVGGSFDVWSGQIKRAPEVYRKMGLEWLYRTVKEPARFKRIFPALPLFLIRVIMETVHESWVKIR